jgi:uncharacterized protein
VRARGHGDLRGESKTLTPQNVERTLLSAAFDFGVDLDCHKATSGARSTATSKPADRSVRSTTPTVAIRNSPTDVTFVVKIRPRAKTNAITGVVDGALKLAITAPPVDSKANQACIDFFAKLLKLPRSSVTIAAGLASRNKVIRVAGLSADDVRKRLNI